MTHSEWFLLIKRLHFAQLHSILQLCNSWWILLFYWYFFCNLHKIVIKPWHHKLRSRAHDHLILKRSTSLIHKNFLRFQLLILLTNSTLWHIIITIFSLSLIYFISVPVCIIFLLFSYIVVNVVFVLIYNYISDFICL